MNKKAMVALVSALSFGSMTTAALAGDAAKADKPAKEDKGAKKDDKGAKKDDKKKGGEGSCKGGEGGCKH